MAHLGRELHENANWLDNLKIRASVGSAGNGLISDAYAYLSTMSIAQSSLLNNGSVFNYTQAPSPIPKSLTWERPRPMTSAWISRHSTAA